MQCVFDFVSQYVSHFRENDYKNRDIKCLILYNKMYENGADDEGRTRDFNLGKVALYHELHPHCH